MMKQIIIEMVKKCQGGKAAVAGFLGMSEAEFNNRLYQTKGQRFTEDELIAIELEYQVSDWSDEVNRRLSKVSFAVPVAESADLVELSQAQLNDLTARGLLFTSLTQFLSDGILTEAEIEELRRLVHKAQTATQQSVELSIVLHKQ